jgi:uncharacterized protein (DUF433 family)
MAAASAIDIGTLISVTEGVNGGRPCIAGTGMSVHQVAVRFKAGLSPEEIVREYPGLSAEGVYAAISHYLANRERIDRELAEEAAEGAEILAASPR